MCGSDRDRGVEPLRRVVNIFLVPSRCEYQFLVWQMLDLKPGN